MAIDKGKLKKWTKVILDLTNDRGEPIKSGAYMLVRAQGKEYWAALLATIERERAALGLTEADAEDQTAASPEAEASLIAENAPQSEEGAPATPQDEQAQVPATVSGKKDLPQEIFNRIAMESHIGRTFGGFYGVKDEEGREVNCRDAEGNLDVAACVEFLEASDDALDQYVTVRTRLTEERDKRWRTARGN